MYDTRSRWHNVVLKSKQVNNVIRLYRAYCIGNNCFPLKVSLPSKIPLQRGSYMFYALEPSSQYEVVIQSQNRWGWSENSEPFFFSTRANGKKQNHRSFLLNRSRRLYFNFLHFKGPLLNLWVHLIRVILQTYSAAVFYPTDLTLVVVNLRITN